MGALASRAGNDERRAARAASARDRPRELCALIEGHTVPVPRGSNPRWVRSKAAPSAALIETNNAFSKCRGIV